MFLLLYTLFISIARMKSLKLQFWLICSLTVLLSSCLDSDDNEYDDRNYSDCQIKSFSLKNDSISGLSDVKFTIDQVNGLIFNKDSMPYGTVIDEKVVCTIEYVISPLNVEVFQAATNDSAYWNGSDSLDFSNYVRFYVYSLDGKAVKKYIARLNIHQQHPDSMTWVCRSDQLLAKQIQEQRVIMRDGLFWMYIKSNDGNELYRSSNAQNWTKETLNGLTDKTCLFTQIVQFEDALYMPTTDGLLYHSVNGVDWAVLEGAPKVNGLLGTVEASEQLKRPSALAAVIEEDGKWLYAVMNEGTDWTMGQEVSEQFPISGFGSLCHEVAFYKRLMIVGGKDRNKQLSNAAWETLDGLKWVRLTDEKVENFGKREGVALVSYDNNFYFFGGLDASGKGTKDIYRSKDRGVTWQSVDTLIVFPDAYKKRGYTSACVDDNSFIYLFGGKENNTATNMLDELWIGRINRLGFKD